MKKFLKPIPKILLIVAVASMINIMAFLTWIVMNPRNIPYLTEKMEIALNSVSREFDVEIGSTVLQWDGWKEAVGIHIKNLKILDSKNEKIASFPDVSVNLRITSLFLGDIRFRNLKILSPRFNLDLAASAADAEDDNTSFSKNMDDIQKIMATAVRFLGDLRKDLPIEGVTLSRMKILILNGKEEIPWEIPEAFIEIIPTENLPEFRMEITALVAENEISLKSYLSFENEKEASLKMELTNFIPAIATDLLPEQEWLKNANLIFDISAGLIINRENGISSSEFQVKNVKEGIHFITYGDMKIHPLFKGKSNVPEITASASLRNMLWDELYRFWPPQFGMDARNWVTEQITGGMVTEATAQLIIIPDDFINGTLSKESLDAVVELDGADVDYHSELPKAENLYAVALFDGNSMNLTVTRGGILNSNISSAKVLVHGMGLDNESMEITGTVEGGIGDLQNFLYFKNTGTKNLLDTNNAGGDAVTEFHFQFPLHDDLEMKEVKFNASSKLSNVTFPGVFEGLDITEGDLLLKTDNNILNIKGNALLGTAKAEIDYMIDDSNTKYDSKFFLKSKLSPFEMMKIGLPAEMFPIGKIDVSLWVENKGDMERMDGKISLEEAQIQVKALGWEKPIGEAVDFQFTAKRKNDGEINISHLSAKGKKVDVEGRIEMAANAKTINSFNFKKLKFGRNNLNAVLSQPEKGDYKLSLKGASFDLAPLIEYYMNSEKDDNGADFGINIAANMAKVHMANDEEMTKADGLLRCDVKKCTFGSLKAKINGKDDVEVDLKTRNNKRVFFLETNNAGSLLRGMNLLKHIIGGTMETTAITDDNRPKLSTQGKIALKDFRVVKAPVLAKLLSLGSLTGILDLLEGQGIVFKKAGGEYLYNKNILSLKGFRASGSAMGLTIDGEANLKSSDVLLRGNLVPAYSINQFLGGIPLIGDMITGGEGEGVIATRYKISGKYGDPDIEVNPLSMLTPGFLRNIWGSTSLDDLEKEPDLLEENGLGRGAQETPGPAY